MNDSYPVTERTTIDVYRGRDIGYPYHPSYGSKRGPNRLSTFDPKSFGRKLRAAREEMDLTQTELSLRSANPLDPSDRISTPYISALERGERESRPSDPMLAALARGLRHKDPWTIRDWAGIEKDPDWATTANAIRSDRNLDPGDQDLMIRFYYRLVGQA